jgi:hypothetical protein
MDVLEGPLQVHPVPRILEAASLVGSTVLEFSLGSKACGGNSTDLENGELWADDIYSTSTVRNEREERESWEWEHPGWDYDDKEEYDRQYEEWNQYQEDVDEVLEDVGVHVQQEVPVPVVTFRSIGVQVQQVVPVVTFRSIGTQVQPQVESESVHSTGSFDGSGTTDSSDDEDYIEESTDTESTVSTNGTDSVVLHETGSQQSTSTRSGTSTNNNHSSVQGSKGSTGTSKGTSTNDKKEETNSESLYGTTTSLDDTVLLRLSAVEDRRIWDALVRAEKVKFVAISNNDLDDLDSTSSESKDNNSNPPSPSITSNTDYPRPQPLYPFATLLKARFRTGIILEGTSTT